MVKLLKKHYESVREKTTKCGAFRGLKDILTCGSTLKTSWSRSVTRLCPGEYRSRKQRCALEVKGFDVYLLTHNASQHLQQTHFQSRLTRVEMKPRTPAASVLRSFHRSTTENEPRRDSVSRCGSPLRALHSNNFCNFTLFFSIIVCSPGV